MQLHGSDPDIQTLIQRMKSNDIDLQPNFQRGEVWPTTKKQKLIDSVLRDWHVPPIHLIEEKETKRQLVLDGQQRLASIRDFANNEFAVNGKIEPHSDEIRSLDGLLFSELPEVWKRRFLQFTIRQFRITDYSPSEPGELFYRLNQPSALTSAEVRNAFFGKTREQVKSILDDFLERGLDDSYWGFSNARMALDDVIARSLYLLDENSLLKKTGSAILADKYRNGQAFSKGSESLVRSAGEVLSRTKLTAHSYKPFNKATAQSWLVFTACAVRYYGIETCQSTIPEFMNEFESTRSLVPLFGISENQFKNLELAFSKSGAESIFQAYDDRAKSRVSDTLSVATRDFGLWAAFLSMTKLVPYAAPADSAARLKLLESVLGKRRSISNSRDVEELVSNIGWGTYL